MSLAVARETIDLSGLKRFPKDKLSLITTYPEIPALSRTNINALLNNTYEHNETKSLPRPMSMPTCENSYPSDKNATRRHNSTMRTRKTHHFGIRKQSRTRRVDIVLG